MWQNSELLEFALLRTEIDHTITQKGEEERVGQYQKKYCRIYCATCK